MEGWVILQIGKAGVDEGHRAWFTGRGRGELYGGADIVQGREGEGQDEAGESRMGG